MRHSPLDTLTDLARHHTDSARQRLGELQRAQLSAQQQLQVLQDYRAHYQMQLSQRMAQGLSVAQLRNDQHFLATLDEAIAQQRRQTEQAGEQLAEGRRSWQGSARKLGAFDTLAQRAARQSALARSRREQRDTDERAARCRSALDHP